MKKPTCTLYGGRSRRAHCMAGVVRHTMCTSVFSFIPQGNEKNQLSILIM